MGAHLPVRKKMTVFEYRYYQRRVIALWIHARRRLKAVLKRG
jgi:hypothetical protein